MKNDDEPPQANLLGRLVSRGYAIIAARPVVTLGIVVALVFLLIYGPAFLLGIKEAFTTPKIERQKQEAATEKTAAEVDKAAAAEAQTERKAEDERRTTEIEPQRRRAASRLDEARQTVATWVSRNAQPKKWSGPTLAAKGGGEVAMEELHLVHEGIDYK
jgi:hypothetical protein